jgi:hypothetical protein
MALNLKKIQNVIQRVYFPPFHLSYPISVISGNEPVFLFHMYLSGDIVVL